MRLQAVRDWQDKSWVFDGHAAGPVGGTAAPLWTRVVVEGECPDADAGLVFGGAALGSDAYIAAAAAKALRKRAANTAPLLELATTNPYEAHMLASYCASSTAKYLLRVTPPVEHADLTDAAADFDNALCSVAAACAGHQDLPPHARLLATMPDQLGGLGYGSAQTALASGEAYCTMLMSNLGRLAERYRPPADTATTSAKADTATTSAKALDADELGPIPHAPAPHPASASTHPSTLPKVSDAERAPCTEQPEPPESTAASKPREQRADGQRGRHDGIAAVAAALFAEPRPTGDLGRHAHAAVTALRHTFDAAGKCHEEQLDLLRTSPTELYLKAEFPDMATFPYQAPVAERRQAARAWRTRIWLPHIAATLAVADYYLTQRIGSGLSPGAFSCFRALPTDHSCAPPMLHRAGIFRAALCHALYLATPGLDNRAITCPDCRCSIVPDKALPRAASFHFASCGGRGGQFLGRATNAMTAIHNSVTHALYAIANEAGCYAQLEQTSRECTEANGRSGACAPATSAVAKADVW